jgi:hypothetical protein
MHRDGRKAAVTGRQRTGDKWASTELRDQQTTMDDAESREEIPRISIDSLRDWRRIKANFSKAVLEQFDQAIRQSGLESEREAHLPHVQQVPIDCSFEVRISSHLLSLLTQPSKRRNSMCESMERSLRT